MSEVLRRALEYRAKFPYCARPVRIAHWVLDPQVKTLILSNGIRKKDLQTHPQKPISKET